MGLEIAMSLAARICELVLAWFSRMPALNLCHVLRVPTNMAAKWKSRNDGPYKNRKHMDMESLVWASWSTGRGVIEAGKHDDLQGNW